MSSEKIKKENSVDLKSPNIEDRQLIKRVMLSQELLPGIKFTKPDIEVAYLREEPMVIAIPERNLDKIIAMYNKFTQE